MKILHIAECTGGVDKYLRMLLPRLKAIGMEQIFVCSHNFCAEDYRDLADKVINVDMQRSISLIAIIQTIRKLREIIKLNKPDIVYLHSSFSGVFGRLACLGLCVKIVYNPHGWAFNMKCSKFKQILFCIIEWLLSKCTDKIIAISNAEKVSALNKSICNADKIQVIFNGIDFESNTIQQVSRESLGIPNDAYIVGTVGRITQQKAPDVFIEAGAKIIKTIPNAWLMIVGEGEQREEILALAKELGVAERLTITGWVDNAEEYTSLFDQAVLLSRWEGFGLVLPEYAKARKPIVATKVGAIKDIIIDKINGRLVSPENSDETAQVVIEIYNNAKMRKDMVDDGYERARVCFNIERVVVEHSELFDKLLNDR